MRFGCGLYFQILIDWFVTHPHRCIFFLITLPSLCRFFFVHDLSFLYPKKKVCIIILTSSSFRPFIILIHSHVRALGQEGNTGEQSPDKRLHPFSKTPHR